MAYNGVLNPPKKGNPLVLKFFSQSRVLDFFTPLLPPVLELSNSPSTEGKKTENTNLMQKLIIYNKYKNIKKRK